MNPGDTENAALICFAAFVVPRQRAASAGASLAEATIPDGRLAITLRPQHFTRVA